MIEFHGHIHSGFISHFVTGTHSSCIMVLLSDSALLLGLEDESQASLARTPTPSAAMGSSGPLMFAGCKTRCLPLKNYMCVF